MATAGHAIRIPPLGFFGWRVRTIRLLAYGAMGHGGAAAPRSGDDAEQLRWLHDVVRQTSEARSGAGAASGGPPLPPRQPAPPAVKAPAVKAPPASIGPPPVGPPPPGPPPAAPPPAGPPPGTLSILLTLYLRFKAYSLNLSFRFFLIP